MTLGTLTKPPNPSSSSHQAFLLTKLSRLAYPFLPQLLRTGLFNDRAPPSRLYPTSWLDGLRGLAALCVFNYHFLSLYTFQTEHPWTGTPPHNSFLSLPIIRLPYLGLPMVNIFFIVAGYVIALKPLQLMHSATSSSREKLLRSLCSSVFRRLFRLYLPVLVAMALVVGSARLGGMEFMRPHLVDKGMFHGRREKQIPRFDTLGEQLALWYHESSSLMSIWDWKPLYPLHDPHLWTVPYEFRSSLVLYLALIGVARVRMWIRLGLLVVICGYCFCFDRWEIVLYLWGACVAQLDIMREHKSKQKEKQSIQLQEKAVHSSSVSDEEKALENTNTPSPDFYTTNPAIRPSPKLKSRIHQIPFFTAFLLSLWLLTSPTNGYRTAPGYTLLSHLIPSFWTRPEKFLPALGSLLLLYLLSICTPSSLLRRLLNSPFCQYLGRVSFSLYLMHGFVLHSGGYYIPVLMWKVLDRSTTAGWVVGLVIGWGVSLGVTMGVADIFAREVDGRCVKAAKWIEERCFVGE